MRVTPGSIDVTTCFVLRKASDALGKTGATITDIDLQYCRSGVAPAAKVDATALAATDSAHADNKAIEIDGTDQPGLYRVDWPDAAFAVGVREVILTVKLADCFTEHLRVELETGYSLSDAGQQDLLQARYKTMGTVWCVDKAGNDSNSGLSPDQAKLTPKTVIEAASAYDVVLLGPGTFALGDNVIAVPNGVSVYGSGMDVTVLTSTAKGDEKGAVVKPGSNACIADLNITGLLDDGSWQIAFGTKETGAAQEAFTSAVGRRLRLYADGDVAYIEHSGTCSLTLVDCIVEGKYDTITVGSVNATITVIDTAVVVSGPSATGTGASSGVKAVSGTIRCFNCDVCVTDGGATSTIGYAAGFNGTIEAYGGSVYTSGGEGDIYDARNSAGTLLMLSGVSYDRTKTNGTITHVDATATSDALATVDGIVDAIVADTGTDGVVVAAASKTGYALTSGERTSVANAWMNLTNGIETGVTPKQVLQRIGAVIAGKISGAGEGTEIFVGLDGVTTRATATVDENGNRTGWSYV